MARYQLPSGGDKPVALSHARGRDEGGDPEVLGGPRAGEAGLGDMVFIVAQPKFTPQECGGCVPAERDLRSLWAHMNSTEGLCSGFGLSGMEMRM